MVNNHQVLEAQKAIRIKIFDNYRFKLEKMKTEFLGNYEEGPKRKNNIVASFNDFDMITTLGEGAFGSVVCIWLRLGANDEFIFILNIMQLLVKHKASNNYYAVKVMSKQQILMDKQLDHALNEKRILCAVNFPFLIHMEFNFKDNSNIFFVLPFIAGGDMFSLLRKRRNFKEEDAKFYGAQVILALEYLHFMNILYRDLKPENIVMDTNGYIKITDFGFCKMVTTRTYTLCGTPEYLAPEIILSKGYGKSVDWWSFGVFLYEMIAGYTPFFNEHTLKIYDKITAGKYKFTGSFSTEARDLIKNILQVDLSRRYGILKKGVLDIKGHEWFKTLDWSAILSRTMTAPYIPKLDSPGDTTYFDYYSTFNLVTADSEQYIKEFEHF